MIKKIIAVYPGRFQPFGPHHYKTFKWLEKQFGKNNTFIITSDKTDNKKSPLNFSEKKLVIKQYGISESQIIKVKSPYNPSEVYDKYDPKTTAIVFIYGEKDAGRIKYTKKDGSPGFFQPYKENKDDLQPFEKHGYILVAPHVKLTIPGSSEMSGTALRKFIPNSTPETFKKFMGWYKRDVYVMMKEKFAKLFETLTEANTTSLSHVDDGPRFFYGNWKSYIKSLNNPRKNQGFKVVNWLADTANKIPDRKTDWPNGPLPTVSFWPAGHQAKDKKVDKHDSEYAGTDYFDPGSEYSSYTRWYRNFQKSLNSIDYDNVYSKRELKKVLVETKNLNSLYEALDDLSSDQYKLIKTLDKKLKENDFDGKMEHDGIVYLYYDLNKKMDNFWDVYGEIHAYNKEHGIKVGSAGFGRFKNDDPFHGSVNVYSKFRRRGIATKMYDWAERITGLELEPEPNNSEDAKKFWSARKKTKNITEKINKSQLRSVEKYADRIFSSLGVDVDLSKKHFFDRVNDPRNDEPITPTELKLLFNKTYQKHGEDIADMDIDMEAVMKDMSTNINVPFVFIWDDENKEFDIVAKTVMRKRDFYTPDPILAVEKRIHIPNSLGIPRNEMPQINTRDIPDFLKWLKGKGIKSKRAKIPVEKLKLTQNEIDSKKVARMILDPDLKSDTVLVSNDYYILDGHHRITTFKNKDPKFKNDSIVIDSDIYNILDIVHDYPKVNYKELHELEENILLEGGAYGHMSHPFDNKDFSFNELAKLIDLSLSGELDIEEEVQEKLDGQNIMVTYRDGEIKAARNKTTIKNPLSVSEIADKFAGRGAITNAFVGAMKDLSNSLSKIGEDKLNEIFKDGWAYLNVEIIFPETSNVISYGDSAYLIFLGMVEYDKDAKPIRKMKSTARELQKYVEDANADEQDTFTIISPKAMKLIKHEDFDKKSAKLKSELNSVVRSVGLSMSSTVEDYYAKKFESVAKELTPDPDLQQAIIDRFARDNKSIRFTKKNLGASYDAIKKYERTKLKSDYKDFKWPLEKIFLELGVEVMKNIQTFLTPVPGAAVQKIKDELKELETKIKTNTDPDIMKKFERQLEKLKSLGGFENIVPAEGIVFKYKGRTMKYTGTYAPINQLLGLFRYSR